MTNPLRGDLTSDLCCVFIRNLEIPAQIGIHGHEQGRLQPIRINIEFTTHEIDDVDDDIKHVVDYASIEAKVRLLVNSEHIDWLKPWRAELRKRV